MRYQPVPPLVRRWLAALLSMLLGLGPLATPAYAGLTPLADEPINIKNQAKPNIILTVDDSTSMLYDFLPDYVVSTVLPRRHRRDERAVRLQRLAGQCRPRRAVRFAAIHLGATRGRDDAAPSPRPILPTGPAPARSRRASTRNFSAIADRAPDAT